nr:hypothetical protein [Tanacetum cinerariifolium]
MSTQQDIYAAGSESRPPMLNKENYVLWSSRLLRYAKSRPNGKLIHNSILNGPYVRRMIDEPGDGERDVNVNETFHEQTDDELSERELKQIEANDQAIQTILLGLPEDIYAANVPTAQEPLVRQTSTASTTTADNVPIPKNSASHGTNIPIPSQEVDELNPNAMLDANTFVNPFANSSTSATVASSSSQNVDPSNMHTFYQPYPHEFQWTKDHPLEQVLGEPSRPVLTRNQLRSDGDMCIYA